MKNSIPFILIPLSIAVIYFYVLPQYSTITDLRVKKIQLQETVAKTKEMSALSQDLLAQYNAIPENDKLKIQNMIPAHFDSVKLISDINSVAIKHGMKVKTAKAEDTFKNVQSQVDVSGSQASTPYKSAYISFTVSGSYQALTSFLRDIELSQELLDVRKLTIGGTTSVGSGQVYDFTIIVETYYLN